MRIARVLKNLLEPERSTDVAPLPQPPVSAQKPDRAVEDAWSVLGLVNSWVFHAEAKLGVTLAFLGALFAGLIAMAENCEQPSQTILWLERGAGLSLLLAVLCASIGILPQYKPSWKNPEKNQSLSNEQMRRDHRQKANPLYYRDISRFEKPDYLEDFPKVVEDRELMLKHLSQQIHAISGVATRKFKWSHRAIVFGLLSLLVTGVVGVGLLLGW